MEVFLNAHGRVFQFFEALVDFESHLLYVDLGIKVTEMLFRLSVMVQSIVSSDARCEVGHLWIIYFHPVILSRPC